VLFEVLFGIFNESCFKNKKVDKIKNVKKRKNVTRIKNVKNVFYIYAFRCTSDHKMYMHIPFDSVNINASKAVIGRRFPSYG